MKISNELFCIMATIEMRLGPDKNKCVPLLLMPNEAKELAGYIKEMAIQEYVEEVSKSRKEGEVDAVSV